MLRFSGSRSQAIISRRNVLSFNALRYNSSGTEVPTLSQRELREKVVADALAKDEEEIARAKALRELNKHTTELISSLNKIPSDLINSRLQKLQQDLDKVPKKKVKQLDQELEDFMVNHMNLPYSEVFNRPWAEEPVNSSGGSIISNDEDGNQRISSSTSSKLLNEYPNLKPTADHRPYSEQELYLRQLEHSRQSGYLGSKLTNIYKPRNDIVNPKEIKDTTIASLMAAGCHLGHSKAMWRPSTQPFIYGEYEGIHLIDLNETITALKRASNVIKGVSKKGGVIVYVGTSKSWVQQRALEEAANRSNGFYVSKRWIPGMITNYTEVTKQIEGESKIEVDMANKPTGRLLGEDGKSIIKPDLIVILNPVENRNCINECLLSRVPTIGLCDTNMEPTLLTYPIPCNDDSVRSTSLILGVLSKSAEQGLNERLEGLQAWNSNKSKLADETAKRIPARKQKQEEQQPEQDTPAIA